MTLHVDYCLQRAQNEKEWEGPPDLYLSEHPWTYSVPDLQPAERLVPHQKPSMPSDSQPSHSHSCHRKWVNDQIASRFPQDHPETRRCAAAKVFAAANSSLLQLCPMAFKLIFFYFTSTTEETLRSSGQTLNLYTPLLTDRLCYWSLLKFPPG